MKNFFLIFFLGIFSGHLYGQETDLLDKMKKIYGISTSDVGYRFGLLDGTLPLSIIYQKDKEIFQGLLSYGSNTNNTHQIDGHINNNEIEIYEYDGDAVVSILSRTSDTVTENIQWDWRSQNQKLEIPIYFNSASDTEKKVSIYGSIAGNTLSQIVLRPNKNQISIERDNQINLRWMDYSCQDDDCYEGRPDERLENPVEFSINDNHILIYPNESATLLHEIEYINVSVDSNSYFISYDFPVLKQRKFDKWIQSIIEREFEKENKRLIRLIAEDESTYRFKYRSYGDFYLSLVSDEIISGYLLLRASNHNDLRTIPFNYDREKKRFIQIKDIFKSDFDYPYFLKTNVNKQKRNLIYKEQGVVKKLLRDAPFSHMVLSPSGLVFFTDFNSIYGRRHMVIPFEELKSFVGDRTISKYIQKERFK